ncbi:fumarylacetoacetate hydrolase family protein [Pseudonocardia sp. HH130630-07]|uniref:fumarylacetoacetate hydrolase family protein n=1 Tax=Pseudonocardia sp. HH130630-07 TaxID=1690815 RepID=UPI000814D917|nr:fumarylacetoacetate hydrolase family protein [Pseudonocardia sp. HH130630-07]ANY08568.1 2-hydroxyhepta-2,4-diene-1,7-dioate isomerase [Pseudonocardia sp. HH130630-07]
MRVVRYGDGRPGTVESSADGDLVRELGPSGPGAVAGRLDEVGLLAPCDPRTIVCVGSNYACQVREKGRPWPEHPALFLKAPNAVAGPGEPVLRPAEVTRLEYEGELAVVIGRTARELDARDAWAHVYGLTCANDVTAHDWRADGQWTRAKSADTFLPLGPWIETEQDPGARTLRTRLGDRVVQESDTGQMIFGVPEILAWVTRWITLRPGDVVLTGSPAGVGPMEPGDRVTVEIEGLGALGNPVAARSPGGG